MKKLTTIILTILLLTIAFYLGRTTAGTEQPKQQNKIEVIGVYKDIETAQKNNFYIESGEIAVEFNDLSYCIINQSENYYMFQPSVLGDWQLDNFESLEQLENCVKTYISIQETGSY